MDDVQEQDQYEEQLKEVFNSFDGSGCGSLCPQELAELCQSLHLEDATPVLIQTLLQNQDHLTARVDFDQFKNALILVLSSAFEQPQAEEEPLQKAESPEIQPKFVKGSKRYGRRSTPELIEPISSLSESTIANPAESEEQEDNYDSAVPRKRERWNANESSTEEYEAEGQMHLWNPDEPSTPRSSRAPLSSCLEERLREACEELAISWDRCVDHTELLAVCEHLGLEMKEDDLLSLTTEGVMNVQDFVSQVVNHNKPPTPSASTPYRQLKRHHSMQPFDEGGRRIATPSTLTSTIGTRLFSSLDDGTGFTSVEYVLDAWAEDGIENSAEILQALNFDLNGKLSLGDLAMALENELLVTKNGIHQAVLASFKAEIRHLLECVDKEYREKEKIRSDLEKAEKLKNQLATEVDEHHSAIEQTNHLKLRKLEQDHKEKLTAVRSELMTEMDRIQAQAGLQREELEAEMGRIKEDESFLRDHLSISVKENRRLEMELLDSRERLVDSEAQITKLQTTLDNVMKEKFGDLDPGSADFFHQEERIKQLHSSYEAQCRELQDRIDELQSELQQFHNIGRVNQSCNKPLSEELESKSPGNESDPGIGSEEVQPFNLSLEAEMMLERLKEQHLQEVEELQNQLESKISEYDYMIEKQRTNHEDHEAVIVVQHQQVIQSLREENTRVQSQMQELQSRLEQAELERRCLEQNCSDEKEELENLREEEVGNLRQQLLEAHTLTADLEEQLKDLETQLAEMEGKCHSQVEELKDQQAAEIKKLEKKHVGLLEMRLEEEQTKHQAEKTEEGKRYLDELEKLKQSHDLEMKTKLEEAKLSLQEEQRKIVERLEKQWQEERVQLIGRNEESLQVRLREEMSKLVREHEEKVKQLTGQWKVEEAKLQQHYEATTLQRISEEKSRQEHQFDQKEKMMREIWEKQQVQMEKDYEVNLEVRLSEEKAKLEADKEEVRESLNNLLAAEMSRMKEKSQDIVKELMTKHNEERDALNSMLEKLRDDIAKERSELQVSFSERIQAVKEHFSDDQESSPEVFHADVFKHEQHYQSELMALSERHEGQKLNLEAERGVMEEATENMRDGISRERLNDRHELESFYKKEMDKLLVLNSRLLNDIVSVIQLTQSTEKELGEQINDFFSKLQGNLETNKLLLDDATDKGVEHLPLHSNNTHVASKQQITDTIDLLTERELMESEELKALLKQTTVDIGLDRRRQPRPVSVPGETLKDHTWKVQELATKRAKLRRQDKDQEFELNQDLTLIDKFDKQDNNDIEFNLQQDEKPHSFIFRDSLNLDLSCSSTLVDEGLGLENLLKNPEHDSGRRALHENHTKHLQTFFSINKGNQILAAFKSVTLNSHVAWDSEEYGQSQEDMKLHLKKDEKNQNSLFVDLKCKEESLSELCEDVEDIQGKTDHEVLFCRDEGKPLGFSLEDFGSSFEDVPCHEAVVEPLLLEKRAQPHTRSLDEGGEEPVDGAGDDENQTYSLFEITALYRTATQENLLLHEKIYLLQQKTELLDNLLAHNNEKVRTSHQVLDENYSLKVKLVLLMEHVKELEMKTLKMTDLQIQFEDCMCDNTKLKEQNIELEYKVWNLETRMNIFHDAKMLGMIPELEKTSEDLHIDGGWFQPTTDEDLLDLTSRMMPLSHTQDCSSQIEKLHYFITKLQDKWQRLNEKTQAYRSESCRLAEENLIFRDKIDALKEEDLKSKKVQEELTETMEQLATEKSSAEDAAEDFRQQIAELRFQSLQLEDENEKLSEKNIQNIADMEHLQKQLEGLMEEREKREVLPSEDKTMLSACVSSLEAELTKALEDTAQLEERNNQLSEQMSGLTKKLASMENHLSQLLEDRKRLDKENRGLRDHITKAEERVKNVDETSQAVHHQSARLKADVRVLQKERESLKQEMAVLQKRLQNASDKNRVLERTIHSGSLKNHGKKLLREELSLLMDQEKLLLRQENERLQAEVCSVKGELILSKEKVHQLDANLSSLKQQNHPDLLLLVKALEQENVSLKQELESQKEKNKGCEAGQGQTPSVDSLQQENDALRDQLAQRSTQLLESFQAHFLGLLPPSPHRLPRGQNRGEDVENQQDERERKMKNMEERMREVELSLHNVKLLLKEKVVQLKEQLNRNGKADVLIKDLYVENTQLLKALEITEQRQKLTEKKNYLLEEKICSLNKIVRDLNSTQLTSLPFQYKN